MVPECQPWRGLYCCSEQYSLANKQLALQITAWSREDGRARERYYLDLNARGTCHLRFRRKAACQLKISLKCPFSCLIPTLFQVLRLFEAPLENVVTTGVTADIVEEMEMALKRDLQLEAAENGGKVLLHDEIEEADGSFTITATWEEVKPEE